MGYLRVYTGEASEPHCPRALADSVHMAYVEENGQEFPLNQGYGILYAEAKIRPDDTIAPRGIRDPRILSLDKGYGVLARPADPEGNPVGEELILWRTEDFLRFWQESAAPGEWQQAYDRAGQQLDISPEQWEKIRSRWAVQPRTELKKVEFPLAVGWADPVIFHWEGKWYFLATNDNNNNIGLFIRESPCPPPCRYHSGKTRPDRTFPRP